MEQKYIRPSSLVSYFKYLKDHSELPLDFIANKSKVLTDALQKGTSTHAAIELFIKSGTIDPHYATIMENLTPVINDFKEKNDEILIEETFPLTTLFEIVNFKGTADCVAINHKKKTINIIDWKTNRAMSDKSVSQYKVQLLIYALMCKQVKSLPDYKISGTLVWIAPNTKVYTYKMIFTEKNINELKDMSISVWDGLEYISDQRKITIEKTAILKEKVSEKIGDQKDFVISKLKEIKELEGKILEIKDQIKPDLKIIQETINEQNEQEAPYTFIIDELCCTNYYSSKTDYNAIIKLLADKYQIVWSDLVKECDASRMYATKKIEYYGNE